MVKKLLPANNAQTNGTGDVSDDYVGVGDYHVMSFDMSDVADFTVNNVVLDKSQVKGQNGRLLALPFCTNDQCVFSTCPLTTIVSIKICS